MLVHIDPAKKNGVSIGRPILTQKNRAVSPVRDVIDLYPAIKLEVAIEFQILRKAGTPKERIDFLNARL